MQASQRREVNKKKVKQVLRLIAKGMAVGDACDKIGMSKPTFYHWKRWVLSLEDERVGNLAIYGARLKKHLDLMMGLILKESDCISLMWKVLEATEPTNNYSKETSPYIELTHHSFKKSSK